MTYDGKVEKTEGMLNPYLILGLTKEQGLLCIELVAKGKEPLDTFIREGRLQTRPNVAG